MRIKILVLALLFSSPALASDCKRAYADLEKFDQVIEAKKSEFANIPANPNDKEWVKAKIHHMVDIDQYLRSTAINLPWEQKYNEAETRCFWEEMIPRWQKIDSANTKDLRDLMKIYGWFKISELGKETSRHAWLLAQHADLNPDFQKEVLAILEKLYPIGEVDPANYAYLYDRLAAIADKRPQRYATQGQCAGPGNWQPFPTEDIENVDARRASMGIEPLAETKKRLDRNCH